MEHLGWEHCDSALGIEVGQTLLDFVSQVTAESLATYRDAAATLEEVLCGRAGVARFGWITYPREVVSDRWLLADDYRRGPLMEVGCLIETRYIQPEYINPDTLELSPAAVAAVTKSFERSEHTLIATVGLQPCVLLSPASSTGRWDDDFVAMLVDNVVGWSLWADAVAPGYSVDRCLASALGLSTEAGPLEESADLTPVGRGVLFNSLTSRSGT